MLERLKQFVNTRIGFFTLASIFFWLKTYLAYIVEFQQLGVDGLFQHILLFINPIALTIILFSIALYFKKPKTSYIFLFIIYLVLTIWLYANVLYYREFSDFITMNVAQGGSSVFAGLIPATIKLMKFYDIIYFVDFIFLFWALKIERIQFDDRPLKKRSAFSATAIGGILFAINLGVAEIDRPQLLTRTFDRNYIVKYLGLNFFTLYDAKQTFDTSQIRASADESDVTGILEYVENNYTAPNEEYFGMAEDRNVIYLEMESFQQFLVDYHMAAEDGQTYEVTPFLNDLYHSDQTFSFSNFFHQTGQGKTSDAELLAENSLFGLPQGSAFSLYGSENTFHSFSSILEETKDYTTSVFHGNTGTFWNRNDTYQSFNIDYFFDSNYYDMTRPNSTGEYGLKDKLFYKDSVQYLEQLPQPFYAKMMPVTHHFPYPLSEEDANIPLATSDDSTINNFFVTANYADEAMAEFFNYLQNSGIYENSIIVMYGDHYGISDARNESLAPLLGKDPETWNEYDNTMLQRVPFLIHIPGMSEGRVIDDYSGQEDIMPTVLHLLGIDTSDYVMMGSDLFSEEDKEAVVLRNGTVITPKYTIFNADNVYNTETGENITEQLTEEELNEVISLIEDGARKLSVSDDILYKDLLRFYTPTSLQGVEDQEYIYLEQLDVLVNEPDKQSSVLYQNGGDSTVDLYETFEGNQTAETDITSIEEATAALE